MPRGTGQNLTLTKEELVAVRKTIVTTMDSAIVGRRLCYVDTTPGRGAARYEYDVVTDPQEAEVIGRGDTIPRDTTKLTRTSGKILKLARGFSIHKEDFEAGRHIRSVNAMRAARKVAELENELIFNSADEPDVDGLIDDAGNTTAGAAAWSGGAGVAYPVQDVHDAMALLVADGFVGPYDVVVEAVNFGELGFSQANIDRSELERIKALPFIRNVLVDANVPHATAVVVQPGPDSIALGMSYDAELEGPFYDHRRQLFDFNLTERVTIAVMQPNCICSITGL